MHRGFPKAFLEFCASLLVIALVAGPSLARGAEPAKKWKLAVLDVKATGKVDPKAVEGLSSLIASECAARPDAQVTSGADIRAMVGFEKQREMLGCGEASCLAEIGGALGVDYIVGSEVSQVGGTWLISLSLVDISKAQAVARLTKRATGEAQLVDVTTAAVTELLGALPGKGAVAVAPPKEPPPAEPPPEAPPSAVATAEPASGGRSTVLPWALFGTGVVAAGVGGYFYGSAWSTKLDFDAQQSGLGSGEDGVTKAEADDASFGAALGGGMLIGGAVLIVASTILWPDDEGGGSDVGVVPLEGGAAATVTVPLR